MDYAVITLENGKKVITGAVSYATPLNLDAVKKLADGTSSLLEIITVQPSIDYVRFEYGVPIETIYSDRVERVYPVIELHPDIVDLNIRNLSLDARKVNLPSSEERIEAIARTLKVVIDRLGMLYDPKDPATWMKDLRKEDLSILNKIISVCDDNPI